MATAATKKPKPASSKKPAPPAATSKPAAAKKPESAAATSEPAGSKKPAPATGTQLTCPECGKTFTRPAALGAHRQRAHGIAGTSQNARSRRTTNRGATTQTTARAASASNGASAAVDHDALLRTLFPAGIPPRQDIIAAVNDWLTQADTLARQR
jgi:hypothetical protein